MELVKQGPAFVLVHALVNFTLCLMAVLWAEMVDRLYRKTAKGAGKLQNSSLSSGGVSSTIFMDSLLGFLELYRTTF